MFDSTDLVWPVGAQPAQGGITLALWRHARPTPARIHRMLSCTPGSDYERVERIGAWEKIIAWAQAQQCAEIADYLDTAAHTARGSRRVSAEDALASAEAEIALVLHTTTRTATARATDARELAHRYPATMTALLDGRITLAQARAILDTGLDLDDTQACALEQQLLGRAGRQTLGQLRASARRAALRIDPHAAQKRHERRRRDRKVVLYPERDGMATLAATLPAAEAVGVYAVLDQHARACRDEAPAREDGERRSMDARRADTLVDLILGETGFCSTATAATTTTPAAADADAATADAAATADRVHGERAHAGRDNAGRDNAGRDNAGRDHADRDHADRDHADRDRADRDRDHVDCADADRAPADDASEDRADCDRGSGRRCGGRDHTTLDSTDTGDSTTNHDNPTASPAPSASSAPVAGGGFAGIAGSMPDGNRDRLAWARWLTTPHRARPAAGDPPPPPPPPDPRRLPGLAPPRHAGTHVHVQVRVTVPLDVLTGHSEHPAELAGYGPIPASTARELAADPDSTWYRLVTDPLTGALLDHGTTRYRPPTALRDHVIARHQTCQFPGCRTPAHRCDLDHNTPYDPDAGAGPTNAANLGPKCRPHHRLKGLPGWEVHQHPDGTIVWHTPSGHTYTVEPPPLGPLRAPTPPPAPPTDDDEPAPF
jgi:Domain of unknown function (DUF222)